MTFSIISKSLVFNGSISEGHLLYELKDTAINYNFKKTPLLTTILSVYILSFNLLNCHRQLSFNATVRWVLGHAVRRRYGDQSPHNLRAHIAKLTASERFSNHLQPEHAQPSRSISHPMSLIAA